MNIVHTESSLGWGGQEIRILSEAAGMAGRGHQVKVLCAPGSQLSRRASDYGVAAEELPIGRKSLRGVFALRRWLRSQARPVDVVNCHSSTDSWLAALAVRLVSPRPALVRTRHVSVPIKAGIGTRWLYTGAMDHIVTTGEMLRRQLIDALHLSSDAVTSVPTGVDLERFSPADARQARASLGVLQNRPTVGIVATLRSWKGHRYLLEAMALLRERDLQLVVVGDGPGNVSLRRQVTELGLEDQVIIAGHHQDVVPWLQCMDVFALPSYAHEGVPQALLQAMACGVPVVTTDVGAIPEIARDGETALIVPPRDASALAQALQRLLDDQALAKRISAAAREWVTQRHGYDAMLNQMEMIFAAAVQRRSATPERAR